MAIGGGARGGLFRPKHGNAAPMEKTDRACKLRIVTDNMWIVEMGGHCVLLNSVKGRDGYGVDYVWLTTPALLWLLSSL